MTIDNIIFDFDGVIRDFIKERFEAIRTALLDSIPEKVSEPFIYEILVETQIVHRCHPDKDMKWIVRRTILNLNLPEKVAEKFSEIYKKEKIINKSFLEMMPIFKSKKLYIFSSNTSDFISEWLKFFDLEKYFIIFSTKDRKQNKPNVPLLREFVKTHNIEINKSIFVGDGFVLDILPAKAIGMKAIHISIHANKSITSFSELEEIL